MPNDLPLHTINSIETAMRLEEPTQSPADLPFLQRGPEAPPLESSLTWGPPPDVRAVLAKLPVITWRRFVVIPVDQLNELEALVLLDHYTSEGYGSPVVSRHNGQVFWFLPRRPSV